MEKPPVVVSHSKFYDLTDISDLNDYALHLDKITNNPHKYAIVDNEIQTDGYGNPYILFHYSDVLVEEEKKYKKFSYFSEIISMRNLDLYDSLITDHWAGNIVITFVRDYSTKDEQKNIMHFRILIYYKTNEANVLEPEKGKSLMPVEGGK